ncbi:FRAS1-related extracellular matrix protein 1-like isoform X3 [Branchiostoma floridae]|uniref:FRAS1-related extracellular matrix protein 1-like isoform X3 n=1 Tax=Branchiostoma floridae TaxID=7739 RepID=A0A9J7MD26_BRAFL|nr:FRAS1-related extracellular matrix protein 1-like isoform X3 [Branchiostoma floridae]
MFDSCAWQAADITRWWEPGGHCFRVCRGQEAGRMGLFVLWIFLLVQTCASGNLIQSLKPMNVAIGKTASLSDEHVVFNLPSDTDNSTCKVEVVHNEPMFQRVGVLRPQVFDCQYPPGTVHYIHHGSSLLHQDQVKLRVHLFTQTKTVSEVFILTIRTRDQQYRAVQVKRNLTVSEFFGLSDPLDANILEFVYTRSNNAKCEAHISVPVTALPEFGQLVIGENRRQVQNLREQCDKLLTLGLRYEHLLPPSPDVDFIAITIDVYDPKGDEERYTERLHLPIIIIPGMPNTPPKGSFGAMYILDVDQFILSTITPSTLSAEDMESQSSKLVFNISKPLTEEQGYIVHLDDHTKPIMSFSQADINSLMIGYKPPNTSYQERKVFEVEFTIYDSHFTWSDPVMVFLAVRTSDTNAPRVSINTGLTLLEGQSRPVESHNFQVVDNDNLETVQIIVVGGLRQGRLLVNGLPAIMFTPYHVADGTVVYQHDDSDSDKDNIQLRITDGAHSVRASFPISILPKDDSPPFLINNVIFHLKEGETIPIDGDMLTASDMDSSDDYILFSIIHPPVSGHILKKYSWQTLGHPIKSFLQRDLFEGCIYYQHTGDEMFADSFEFVLRDSNEPPNESEPQSVVIQVIPIDDLPPAPLPEMTNSLVVKETEVGIFTKAHLSYHDEESEDDDLMFTITTMCLFVDSLSLDDAGTVVSTENMPVMIKTDAVRPVRMFHQSEIDHMKIAYVPPMHDIGPKSRTVQFIYSVSDPSGNTVTGQRFDITILPVDNVSPEVQVSVLTVKEGQSVIITVENMMVTDIDTPVNEVVFIVSRQPNHGSLQVKGVELALNGMFTFEDLLHYKISYSHDGSEIPRDKFSLKVSDGVNSVTMEVPVEVHAVNDESPVMLDGLHQHLTVPEGETVLLTPEVLAATDTDTDDFQLTFIVVQPPHRGMLYRDGVMVTQFRQQDVHAGAVSYSHTGGEVGMTALQDSFTLVVSDDPFPRNALPVHDVNITITPVDNQPPDVILGSPFIVDEGLSTSIQDRMLNAYDVDTDEDNIGFIVTLQPAWGYVENIAPMPGHEKGNVGIPVSSFQLRNIKDGHIRYVQSVHIGTEPTQDQLVVCATDGRHQSNNVTIPIAIRPRNDEVPNLTARDIDIVEGAAMELNLSMLDVTDLDLPPDDIIFSVTKLPKHGQLFDSSHRASGSSQHSNVPQHFTLEELKTRMRLVYRHDGSESKEDVFSIAVTDGKHIVKKTVKVSIKAVNDEKPEVIRNTGLIVGRLESKILSSVVLQSQDKDDNAKDLVYVPLTVPKRGVLQLRQKPSESWKDIKKDRNFTQWQVDMNMVRYLHTGLMGSKGMDVFNFYVTDGVNVSPMQDFIITIKKMKKTGIQVLSRDVHINEGSRVVLSSDVLSATDGTNEVEKLIFTVQNPPSQGNIEDINEPGVPLYTFSQLELLGRRVVYVHTSKADVSSDLITFTVTNGVKEQNVSLTVSIMAVDDTPPTLSKNLGIKPHVGEVVTITSQDLLLTDPDSSMDNLVVNIIQGPRYGQILIGGVPVADRFTQADIDAKRISYRHSGGKASIDRFSFTATDGRNKGFFLMGKLLDEPVFFEIEVDLTKRQPLQVRKAVPSPLLKMSGGRVGFQLTDEVLKVGDSVMKSVQFVFTVTRLPLHGYLERRRSGSIITTSFTQEDISDGDIVYILNKDVYVTSDSFLFDVSDSDGNILKNQRFHLKWSTVEMVHPQYSVCEDVGSVSILLRRRGNLDQSVFVGVHVKGLTGEEGQDFTTGRAQQIQFDPGVSERQWTIGITKDNLQENKEKFRVQLRNPDNTLLGQQNKSLVIIHDFQNGKCSISAQETVNMEQARQRPRSSGSVIMPSSFFSNGTLRQWMYHGLLPVKTRTGLITSAQVSLQKMSPAQDERSNPRRPSTAIVKGNKKRSGVNQRPCDSSTKGLLQYESKQLYQCNGRRWQLWKPQEQPLTGGCQTGWTKYGSLCYRKGDSQETWNDAQLICRERHSAELPTILSSETSDWISTFVNREPVWIGLNDKGQQRRWKWPAGQSLSYTNWKPGQPDSDSDIQRNCVVMNQLQKWNVRKCHRGRNVYICAKEVGS